MVQRVLDDGDETAFGILYRRHAGTVGATVTRLLASREEAEDVVHDAFLRAFEKLHTLRDPNAFRPWVTRTAVMLVRQRLRRRRARRWLALEHHEGDATLAKLSVNSAPVETRAELALLDHALARMSADHRLAWMLRYVEGYKLREMADLCDCSLSTIKRRLQTAERRMEAVAHD